MGLPGLLANRPTSRREHPAAVDIVPIGLTFIDAIQSGLSKVLYERLIRSTRSHRGSPFRKATAASAPDRDCGGAHPLSPPRDPARARFTRQAHDPPPPPRLRLRAPMRHLHCGAREASSP